MLISLRWCLTINWIIRLIWYFRDVRWFYAVYIFKYLQDDDLAMIVAQQYYIDYGYDMHMERLQSLLPSYIPDSCLQNNKALNYWMQAVMRAHKKSYFVRDRVPPLRVRYRDIFANTKHWIAHSGSVTAIWKY